MCHTLVDVPTNGTQDFSAGERCLLCAESSRVQGVPWLLLNGYCIDRYICHARRSTSTNPRLHGVSCLCTDGHCHRCVREVSGDTCLICRDGFYLLNGNCLESCPRHLASVGLSQWRRRCLQPFTCRMTSSRTGIIEGANVSYGCRCPDQHCGQCHFAAGTNGSSCLQCRNRMYLHRGQCIPSCADTGLAAYAPARRGRQCREPFVCAYGYDRGGNPCRCSSAIGYSNSCTNCTIDLDGQHCTLCNQYRYLNTRSQICKRRCQSTYKWAAREPNSLTQTGYQCCLTCTIHHIADMRRCRQVEFANTSNVHKDGIFWTTNALGNVAYVSCSCQPFAHVC